MSTAIGVLVDGIIGLDPVITEETGEGKAEGTVKISLETGSVALVGAMSSTAVKVGVFSDEVIGSGENGIIV